MCDYLYNSEITLNDNYKMITKKGKIPVYTATYYSNNKRLLVHYFSSIYSIKDISNTMDDILHKKYPKLKELIEKGIAIVDLEINRV